MTSDKEDLMPDNIKKPKFIMTEGDVGEHVIRALTQNLDISQNFKIHTVKGKNNIRGIVDGIVTSRDFRENVESFCIARDGDNNPSNSFQKVSNALNNANLNSPSSPFQTTSFKFAGKTRKTAVIIFPDGQSPGEVEDLLLDSVKNEPAMSCVNEYFQCVKSNLKRLPNKIKKARARVFLASKKELRLSGIAAYKGYWNLSDSCFDQTRKLLKRL